MSGEFAALLSGNYIAEAQNQKEATANAMGDLLTSSANSVLVVPCSPGVISISAADFGKYGVFRLTGSLAGSPNNFTLHVPESSRSFKVINATTSGYATISNGQATTTSLQAGASREFVSIPAIGVVGIGADANAIIGGDVVGPSSASDGHFAVFSGATGKLIADTGLSLSIDGTFAANSDTFVPSQKAVKTYADTKVSGLLDTDGTLAANSDARVASQKAIVTYVANKVTGLLHFQSSTDCSGNPNYPAAVKGDAYVVSVAGKIGGASGTSVDVGDVYFAIADNAGGTQASVGSSWDVLEHNLVGALLTANALSELTGVASTARTNLGATTVGANFFTLANPGAIRYPRIDAANTVTALSLASFQADLQQTGTTAAACGYMGVPQGSHSANYTTVAADAGKHLYHPSGGGASHTFTIDSNANVAYDIGTAITFVNRDTNNLSIAITSDTLTLASSGSSGTRTLAQYGIATALKITSTEWIISGTGLT